VRKIIEIANEFEPVQDGRIYIEKINGPMLFQLKVTPAEYKGGLDRAIEKGWLVLHESGTFVKFTQAGADLRMICARCDDTGWVCEDHTARLRLWRCRCALPCLQHRRHTTYADRYSRSFRFRWLYRPGLWGRLTC
jgi:hypothetical protein